MQTQTLRTYFACLAAILALSNNNAYSEIVMQFYGIIDSSVATGPVATTSHAANGDSVLYTVVLPDISVPNEQFPGLFAYSPLSTSIGIGAQTYSSTSTIYTGFHNYVNPAIGTYNGVFLQDTYGANLEDGQFALYNLTGAQTTDAMGILTPSGLIPAPGADSNAGYNIGILHFSDSQTPQEHTYWHITSYSIGTAVPEPSIIALFGVGIASLVGCRRRQR